MARVGDDDEVRAVGPEAAEDVGHGRVNVPGATPTSKSTLTQVAARISEHVGTMGRSDYEALELSCSPSTDGLSRATRSRTKGVTWSTDRAPRQVLEPLHHASEPGARRCRDVKTLRLRCSLNRLTLA